MQDSFPPCAVLFPAGLLHERYMCIVLAISDSWNVLLISYSSFSIFASVSTQGDGMRGNLYDAFQKNSNS